VVAVSGPLGLAAEGLRLLFERGMVHETPNAAAAATLRESHPVPIAAQLRPSPPIADGVAAALAGASGMLDLSDGLAIDARRVAAASGVTLDLDPDGSLGLTPAELDGGEDHSLLATFPPEAAAAGLPGGFRPIGVVREPRDDGRALLVGGEPYSRRGGWDPYDGWDGQAG
jgi:thiamine-monophosphate kinase